MPNDLEQSVSGQIDRYVSDWGREVYDHFATKTASRDVREKHGGGAAARRRQQAMANRGKPCGPGQTAARDGCIPAGGGGSTGGGSGQQDQRGQGRSQLGAFVARFTDLLKGAPEEVQRQAYQAMAKADYVVETCVEGSMKYIGVSATPEDIEVVKESVSWVIQASVLGNVAQHEKDPSPLEWHEGLTMMVGSWAAAKAVIALCKKYGQEFCRKMGWIKSVGDPMDIDLEGLAQHVAKHVNQLLELSGSDRRANVKEIRAELEKRIVGKAEGGRNPAVQGKSLRSHLVTKDAGGPCKPGQTAAETGCIPATGGGGMRRQLPGDDAAPSSSQKGSTKLSDAGIVEGDKEKFFALKKQWAQVNDKLLGQVNTPDSKEAKQLMDQLKDLVKQMYRLHADPGGTEGIGLPGGPRDVIIVGAGPGGLAASIMGGTDGLDTLIVDANPMPGGQSKYSSRIENYPGFPIGVTGEDLAKDMYEQTQRTGAEVRMGVRVTGISHDPKTGMKKVTFSDGSEEEARAVVIAGGIKFVKLDFKGSDHPDVVYADGKMLAQKAAGKSAVVIGGSNGAAQAALGTARTAKEVTVLSRSPIEKGMSDYQVQALRANPKIHIIEGDEAAELLEGAGPDEPHVLKTKGGEKIDCAAVGVFVGGGPDSGWLPKEINLDHGRVKVNESLETSMPGVFAVGDIRTGGLGRIGGAVGDGQQAVRNVWAWFEKMKSMEQSQAQGKSVKKGKKDKGKDRRNDKAIKAWDALIDKLWLADQNHPYLGQSIETEYSKGDDE